MKKLLLIFILIPTIAFCQVQIGQDIDGEFESDLCGSSIALSSDGNIVAIGARGNDENGRNSGQVRVYENIGGIWTQIGQDINGDADSDSLGWTISLSSDGSIVAMGAIYDDNNGNNSGSVRVYENIGGFWIQIGNDINGEDAWNESGYGLSLSSDGSKVAIGAWLNSNINSNGINSGHVRIYENISGVWIQVGHDIDGEEAGDVSGYSVSLSSNGSIVAIGARFNDGNGFQSGHVRVYQNQSLFWTQIGEDIDGKVAGEQLGFKVSLSSDGNIIAMSSANFDNVRVYENIGGIWTQIGEDINGETENDRSGYSLSLSSDGSIVAIGAINNNGNGINSGNVRIYQNQAGIWTQIGQDIDGEAEGDQSGNSVGLSSDGTIVAIGSQSNDGIGTNSGHVRVYDLSDILSIVDKTIYNFNIYPNPTKNQFTIQLENSAELENVTIYNNLGQLVLTSNTHIIDSSKLSSGLYIVELETTKGKGSKKLIIE